MKKFLLILFMGVVSSHAVMAQLITSSQMITTHTKEVLKPTESGYEQSVELYYMAINAMDYKEYFYPGMGVDYIGGYRLNNTFFIGAGVGFYYDFDSGLEYSDNSYCNCFYTDEGSLMKASINIPLYAHVRAYIGKGRVQPFFSASIGGKFSPGATVHFMDRNWEPIGVNVPYSRCSFLIAPAVGLNIRCNNCFAMYLNVACWAQTEPYHEKMEITHPMKASIKISLGCTF